MSFRAFWHGLAVLCLLIILLPFETLAQSVRGRVVEAESETPIRQANLLFRSDDETQGTSTDSTGRFQLSLAPGEYTVEVSATGYRSARRVVTVQEGQSTSVRFALASREYSLNEIVVSGQQQETEASVTTVQRVDPAAIEAQDAADVSELAELVPATHVQTNSRGQTILYFRNAGDRQVGQFFDGALLNIPWDNRVNISLIPASVVENVTVTKGHQPPVPHARRAGPAHRVQRSRRHCRAAPRIGDTPRAHRALGLHRVGAVHRPRKPAASGGREPGKQPAPRRSTC
jgi:iron complex outermembrane receptor protein